MLTLNGSLYLLLPKSWAGMTVRQSFATGVSGSSYVHGYVDAANALALAVEWNGFSGGPIQSATIQESAVEWQVLWGDQIPKLHCRFTTSLNPSFLGCSKRYSH